MKKKKSKIIEVVKLNLRFLDEKKVNPSFNDILKKVSSVTEIVKLEGKEYSIKKLSSNQVYTIGLIITKQVSGIPPKADKNLTFNKLPLGEGEGLGFANVFLYYKTKGILLYEINKNGCFIETFVKVIHYISNEQGIEPFDLRIESIFQKNQYDRILKMRIRKQLHINIAQPSALISYFKDSKDAVGKAIEGSGKMNADSFKLELKYDFRSQFGLPSMYFTDLLNKMRDIIKVPEKRQHLIAFQVKGYSDDVENPNKLLPVDLLGDVYRKEIKLTENELNSDLQETERKTEIIELFNKCKDELDAIFA